MPKINKNQNQHKKKNVFDTKFYFLLSSLLIVFIVYSFSLFRPWQPFDERVFYSESLFPTPTLIPRLLSAVPVVESWEIAFDITAFAVAR